MREISPIKMALTGGALIAVTYGFARFVFGLFLPQIRIELGLDPSVAGVIGALPYLSFIGAILVAPLMTRLLNVRTAASGIGLIAFTGLLGIALSTGPVTLGLSVLCCGLSTGLSLPIMAEGVQHFVRSDRHGRVNAAINAATSVGIAVAALSVMGWSDAWRSSYAVFAGLAMIAIFAVLCMMPAESPRKFRPSSQTGLKFSRLSLLRGKSGKHMICLALVALAMGMVSAVYWVFAPDFAVNRGGLSSGQSALIWLVVGIGGLIGVYAGDLIDRYGFVRSHTMALAVLSGALYLLVLAPGNILSAMLSAVLFGAAYMTLTGLYLVASVRTTPESPSLGPVIPLISAASGQVLGASLAGWAISAGGYTTTFIVFAMAGLAVSVCSLALPGVGQYTTQARA